MNWRPILMSDEMAQAAFDGRKTQTRRPVRPQPEHNKDGSWTMWKGSVGKTNKQRIEFYENGVLVKAGDEVLSIYDWLPQFSPFGQPGDGLYVRECWAPYVADIYSGDIGILFRAAYDPKAHGSGDDQGAVDWSIQDIQTARAMRDVIDHSEVEGERWTPSIHMPKWAARTWLKVKRVWVERVSEISWDDAIAEYVCPACNYEYDQNEPITICDRDLRGQGCASEPPRLFADLWDTIYKPPYDFDSNPWVFACEFEKTDKPSEAKL